MKLYKIIIFFKIKDPILYHLLADYLILNKNKGLEFSTIS